MAALWRPGIPSGYGWLYIFSVGACDQGDTHAVQSEWGHLLP